MLDSFKIRKYLKFFIKSLYNSEFKNKLIKLYHSTKPDIIKDLELIVITINYVMKINGKITDIKYLENIRKIISVKEYSNNAEIHKIDELLQ